MNDLFLKLKFIPISNKKNRIFIIRFFYKIFKKRVEKALKVKNYWEFFILVFLYSWLFWVISILSGADLSYSLSLIFYYLGGIGPSLMGILLTYRNKEKEDIKDFWRRSIDPRLIEVKWYILIVLIVITPILIGIGFDILFGGNGATYEGFINFQNNFLVFLPYLLFLIIAVLAEEFGWRGYAQDALQKRFSIIISGLIVGFFWSLWHLPLFFIKGTYQNSLGIGSFSFWLFFVYIIPESVIYAWIFNLNNRSILSAILYHLIGNFLGEMFNPIGIAPFVRFLTILIIAVTLSLIYSRKAASEG